MTASPNPPAPQVLLQPAEDRNNLPLVAFNCFGVLAATVL